jgi:hypothetical protein
MNDSLVQTMLNLGKPTVRSEIPRMRNTEHKSLWIIDLREHPETQGQRMLHYIDKDTGKHYFCCLGRACALAYEEDPDIMPKRETYPALRDDGTVTEGMENRVYVEYDRNRNFLPDYMSNWLGLQFNPTSPKNEYEQSWGDPVVFEILTREGIYETFTLSGLNDALNFTFHQIADVIDYFL